MPVANSQKDAQNQLLQHYQQFLPKSPSCHLGGQLSQGADNYIGREDAAALVTDLQEHLSSLSPSAASDRASGFFSTHSPPILNLSPNLSPSAPEPQRVSPTYDLRETTRRRTHYGGKCHYLKCQIL
ncbi:hypothetical protein FSP39_020303 [Pinctada imbricata]|uniref:Uncharacterized protein n=1 Tax=Pinctada imbricata TaxID=66713 RepID=A0AA89C5U7_PINIB|nr:hypothetical protein FSP39_020303 [Pinctada imbricata]